MTNDLLGEPQISMDDKESQESLVAATVGAVVTFGSDLVFRRLSSEGDGRCARPGEIIPTDSSQATMRERFRVWLGFNFH